MSIQQKFELVFPDWFGEKEKWEAESRGYLSHVIVKLNSSSYDVVFYDCVRLAQDMEYHRTEQGGGCIAEPGLIILDAVTVPNITRAVTTLVDGGYFSHLVPSKTSDPATN